MIIGTGFRNNCKRCNLGIGAAILLCGAAQAQTDLAADAAVRTQKAVTATGVETPPADFYAHAPYRPDVPRPDTLLGYPLGTWHTTFRDQERVLQAIAHAAPDRVRTIDYGTSVEGRPLRVYAVSSSANIARLDDIRAANLQVARTGISPANAPAVVWLNHCIHGSETASFETAMATLYTLAASDAPDIRAALDNAVVIINPVFNPDGHERFVVSYNAAATGDPDDFAFESETPWLAQGRFNHNRFDMNRDKIAQSQPETQAETREYLRWMPHVFADLHGQPQTYFFPPNAQATNAHVDRARMDKWTQVFGEANAAVFDSAGVPFVTRETFDLFYPGYLDSFTSLQGAVGMTYETDGGGELATKKRDGTITTLRNAATHHFVASLATVKSAAANRDALVRDFAAFRISAIKQSGGVFVSNAHDPKRTEELAALLQRMGVNVRVLTAPATALVRDYAMPGAKPVAATYPTGSLIVAYGQPQGHLARALLERDAALEPDFAARERAKRAANAAKNDNESRDDYDFYDITAWSLPLLFNLDAGETDTLPVALAAPFVAGKMTTGGIMASERNAPAYAIELHTDNALVLAVRFTQNGNRVSVATKPVTVNGVLYTAGTVFVRTARNPGGAITELSDLAETLGVRLNPVSSTFGGTGATDAGLGSQSLVPVSTPKVAVLAGDGVSQTGFGGVTFALRQSGIAFTPVSVRAWKNETTRAAFNTLILPEGGYGARFDKDDRAALKTWVKRGNALVALGSATDILVAKDAGFTTVTPVDGNDTKDKSDSPTYLPGAIFRATIRTDHFLGWGYPGGAVPVPLAGDTFWQPSTTGTNLATFPTGNALLSGFTWSDTQKAVAGSAYIVDEPIGSGHALLFLQDPCDRALYPGLLRLFLSAVLFGRL